MRIHSSIQNHPAGPARPLQPPRPVRQQDAGAAPAAAREPVTATTDSGMLSQLRALLLGQAERLRASADLTTAGPGRARPGSISFLA